MRASYTGDEAAAALVRVAGQVDNRDRARAVAAVEEVRSLSKNEGVVAQAEKTLDKLERHQGFITAWQVSGPYSQEGRGGAAGRRGELSRRSVGNGWRHG